MSKRNDAIDERIRKMVRENPEPFNRIVAIAEESDAKEPRSLLEMHFMQGMTLKAISAQLGMPVGTIKSKTHREKERARCIYLSLDSLPQRV